MMRCDLRSLEILIDVASTGSMAQTARRMGISQPAVSQQIKRLERRYGVRLFDRLPVGIALTQDGERVAQLVGRLFDAIASIDRELKNISHASTDDGPKASALP